MCRLFAGCVRDHAGRRCRASRYSGRVSQSGSASRVLPAGRLRRNARAGWRPPGGAVFGVGTYVAGCRVHRPLTTRLTVQNTSCHSIAPWTFRVAMSINSDYTSSHLRMRLGGLDPVGTGRIAFDATISHLPPGAGRCSCRYLPGDVRTDRNLRYTKEPITVRLGAVEPRTIWQGA